MLKQESVSFTSGHTFQKNRTLWLNSLKHGTIGQCDCTVRLCDSLQYSVGFFMQCVEEGEGKCGMDTSLNLCNTPFESFVLSTTC